MHSQIRKVGIGITLAFLAVFAQLNYVQVFAARDIASHDANSRSLIQRFSVKRGDVLTSDRVLIATSVATPGRFKYERRYPEGELYGHITGFASIVYGAEGIERTFDGILQGEEGVLTMQDIEDRLFGDEEQGDQVFLTIESTLQEAARSALGDVRGSVVALDPRTGQVLALWSNPSFDPGPLASHDPKNVRSYYQSLNPRSRTSPMIPLATARGYPPGSTFKTVTASAALESGRFDLEDTFPDTDGFTPPQTTESIENFSGGTCLSGGEITFRDAFRVSCNTTFARLGLEVHRDMLDVAEGAGFNRDIPFEIRTEASTFTEFGDDDQPGRASEGIGQRGVIATPLQMALVAAAIANDGQTPRPRLVKEIIDPAGGVVRRYGPETMGEAMSPETAAKLKQLMVLAVAEGTGTAAQLPGVEVAGKTGTAQTGIEGQNPHAWFIAFAPAHDPQIAIAVIVENGGTFGAEATGGTVAAPIARQVLEADRRLRAW